MTCRSPPFSPPQPILVKSNIDWASFTTVFHVLRSWRRKEKQTSMTVDESWRHVHRSLERGRINTWRRRLRSVHGKGELRAEGWPGAGCPSDVHGRGTMVVHDHRAPERVKVNPRTTDTTHVECCRCWEALELRAESKAGRRAWSENRVHFTYGILLQQKWPPAF